MTTVDPAAAWRVPAPADVAPAGRPDGPVTRLCDAAVDHAVVVLATWTLVYHLALVVDLSVATAAVIEALVLLAWAGLRVRSHRRRHAPDVPVTPATRTADMPAQPHQPEAQQPDAAARLWQRAPLVVAGAAVAAGVLMATNAAWGLVAAAWLVASVAGVAVTWHRLRLRGQAAPTRPSPDTWVALAWASGLAVLSMITLRPNPDDLYYLNLSQWVAERGTFPTRDTIFSDLAYPMSSWPPMASYDALGGTVARLLEVQAGSIVYVVVPPVATFLSVLALWRLLRTWRVRPVWVALSVALLFLLLDADLGYAAPGTLFLTRLWQGKVIVLCLIVPVLLVYALRYVERPTRARAGWLFVGGVAAVGLSTTAIFLVPLIAVAGAAPLLRRAPRRAWVGFAAMAAYPLAAGAFTVAVGGRSADDFSTRRLYRFDPAWFGHEIFLDGVLALVAVTAVLLGALLVPHRGARLTTALLALVTGITFIPGVTEISYDLVGLGPTLWRVSWVASIAALVGVLGAAATRIAWPTQRVGPLGPRGLRLVGPAALAGALVVGGVPIWSEAAGAELADVPHWQRGESSLAAATMLVDRLEPGDVVLAPPDLGVSLAVSTTRIKTVAPRKYFMDYLSTEPDFHYAERELLMDFVDPPPGSAPVPVGAVLRALRVVGVDAVCVPSDDRAKLTVLDVVGLDSMLSSVGFLCVRR